MQILAETCEWSGLSVPSGDPVALEQHIAWLETAASSPRASVIMQATAMLLGLMPIPGQWLATV